MLGSCAGKTEPTPANAADTTAVGLSSTVTDCEVKAGNVTFTRAYNGADTLTQVKTDGTLAMNTPMGRDFFRDPNDGILTQSTAPILLTKVDNTKPFTFSTKVTPGFTREGLYNAAAVYVLVNDTLWQKFCYEQDERGNHRIVSVRTIGTSDDNNHEVLTQPSVYLKVSSDTRTIAYYYSKDNKEWQMVRLYRNSYPKELWVGVSSQCPQKTQCNSLFQNLHLDQTQVGDFRMGS